MGTRLFRASLQHKGLVTVVALGGLLLNLMVIGSSDAPEDLGGRDLPMAAQCHGGGAGCAEQPLIPPPAVGLPRFDAPAPATYGVLVLVEPSVLPDLTASPPRTLVPPPLWTSAA